MGHYHSGLIDFFSNIHELSVLWESCWTACVFFLSENVGSSFCVQLFQSIIQWTLLALFIHQWCSFTVFMYRSIMSQSISSWLSMWANPLEFSPGFFLSGSKPEPSIQPCFPANAMLLVWCLQTVLKPTKGSDNQQRVVDPASKSSKKMQRESLCFVYNQWFPSKHILILITHCLMWVVQIPPVLILRVFCRGSAGLTASHVSRLLLWSRSGD